MAMQTLGAALEREHHEIDAGIEAATAQPPGAEGIESLRAAMTALRRHIYLEEEFLFPPLREAGLVAPVFVMLREHGQIWASLDALDAALEHEADPTSLRETCQELLGLLSRHNAKEEPILYAQADEILGAAATGNLQEFIATGTLPAGWSCAQAPA